MIDGFHFETQDITNKIKAYQEREYLNKNTRIIDPLQKDKLHNPTLKYPEKNLILNLGSAYPNLEPGIPFYPPDDPNQNIKSARPYYNVREYQRATNPISLGMSRTPIGNVGPIIYY